MLMLAAYFEVSTADSSQGEKLSFVYLSLQKGFSGINRKSE